MRHFTPKAVCFFWASLVAACFNGAVRAETVTATIAVGASPEAIGVNPATNKIYIANKSDNTVTVLDGATNSTTVIAVGLTPNSIAVDTNTNKIYVSNLGSSTVTEIDGLTNSTTTIALYSQDSPLAMAVDPTTNELYIADTQYSYPLMTVIDLNYNDRNGGSLNSNSVVKGLALNPETKLVYILGDVPNGTGIVTEYFVQRLANGATSFDPIAVIDVGHSPQAISLNPVTNNIYVANSGDDNVTVIDGTTLLTTTLNVGIQPNGVIVNSKTNQIYVTDAGGTLTVIDGSSNSTTTVNANASGAFALNSSTNRLYVANNNNGTIAAIDGYTKLVTTLPVGNQPSAVAANPITNRIYIANKADNTLTIINGDVNTTTITPTQNQFTGIFAINPITDKLYADYQDRLISADGSFNSIATVTYGNQFTSIAVNPVTNKIYAIGNSYPNLTVIDGFTGATHGILVDTYYYTLLAVNPITDMLYVASNNKVQIIDESENVVDTVPTSLGIQAIAVNCETNKIYVLNSITSDVLVIDGVTHATSTVKVGDRPSAMAINTTTNKIYVVNYNDNNVTIIDGTANSTSTISVGVNPYDISVNPITNRIYIASIRGDVTVIDGNTLATSTVIAGPNPFRVVANPVIDMVYILNNDNTVSVLDCATNTINSINTGANPYSIQINPFTNKIYISSGNAKEFTVISPGITESSGLSTEIAPLPGNRASSATPTFTLHASSNSQPVRTTPLRMFYQTDTWTGAWAPATVTGSTAKVTTSELRPGVHILYAFAGDGQDSTSVNTGPGSSPITGSISAYLFVVPNPATVSLGGLSVQYDGDPKSAFVTTTPYGLSTSITYNGSATPPINAGSYFVVATIIDPAYTGSVTGTMVIAKAPQSINFGALFDQNYTTTAIGLSATASSGLPIVFSITGPATVNGNTLTISHVGSVTVTASQPGDSNYEAAISIVHSFIIQPAPLLVNADNAARTYGASNPGFNVHYTGFVKGDSEADLAGILTITTAATISSHAGNYGIMPNGQSSTDYAVTFIDGTLTVTPASASVILGGLSSSYDGTPKSAAATTVPPGLTTSITYNGSSAPPINAGSYNVAATVMDPDYAGSSSGVQFIAKASQTITFGAISNQIYGTSAIPLLASATSGLPVVFSNSGPASVLGNTLILKKSGFIKVTASQPGDANYTFASSIDQSFYVLPAPLTITAKDASRPYATTDPVFGAYYNGFVNGDTALDLAGTLAFFTETTLSSVPGAYSITPSGLTSDNYSIIFVQATLKITPESSAPTIASPLSADTSLATAGTPVNFSVGATGAGSLSYLWDFGDGTTSSLPAPSHTYANTGVFTVTVTITNGTGLSTVQSVTLNVALLGSNELPSSFAGSEHATQLQLADSRLRIRLNFARAGADVIYLASTLLLSNGFKAAGSRIIFYIGGVEKSFNLDDGGNAKDSSGFVRLADNGTSARTSRVILKIKGNFAATLSSIGLINASATKTVKVPLALLIGNALYERVQFQSYSAITGRMGISKDKN